VEIFQNKDQRILCCQCLQGLANFPHHSLSRSTENLLLQSFSLLALSAKGMNQPRRGLLRQGLDHLATASFTGPLAEGFQHGVIRFLAAEPSTHARERLLNSHVGQRLLERINERCLPIPPPR